MKFEHWLVILLVINVFGWVADYNTELDDYTILAASISCNVICVWFARVITSAGDKEFQKRTVNDFKAIVILVSLTLVSGSIAYLGYLTHPFEIKDAGKYQYHSWTFGYFVLSICFLFVYLLAVYLFRLSRESKHNKSLKSNS